MKFQKILITGFRDMDKQHQKCPKNGGLPLFPLRFYSKKSGSVTFVPLWCPNFMQKIEKTNEQSLRYLKTDTHTSGQTRAGSKMLKFCTWFSDEGNFGCKGKKQGL